MNGIHLDILQFLKLKFAKINKQGGPDKVLEGLENILKNQRAGGGDVY